MRWAAGCGPSPERRSGPPEKDGSRLIQEIPGNRIDGVELYWLRAYVGPRMAASLVPGASATTPPSTGRIHPVR